MKDVTDLTAHYEDVKGEIFGEAPPEGTEARVGYNFGHNHYDRLIEEFEKVSLHMRANDDAVQILLRDAFRLSESPHIQNLPAGCKVEIRRIEANLKARYGHLQNG